MAKRPTPKKGLSPVVIGAGLVVAAAALGGGYLYLSQSGAASSIPILNNVIQPAFPRATEKDFESVKDPLIRKHFVAQSNQTSFRMQIYPEGKGAALLNEFQMKGNDINYRSVDKDENGKEITSLVSIGDTTYLKDMKDGKWWKQKAKPATITPTGSPVVDKFTPEDFKKEFENKQQSTYNQLGKEPCGNLTCYKYEEIDQEQKDQKRLFWFDDKQYLLRREEYQSGESTSRTEYSYDNINITAPSPTKDVPEGHDIYEYMWGGPSSLQPQKELDYETQKKLENAQKQMENVNGNVQLYSPLQNEPADQNTEPPQDTPEE